MKIVKFVRFGFDVEIPERYNDEPFDEPFVQALSMMMHRLYTHGLIFEHSAVAMSREWRGEDEEDR